MKNIKLGKNYFFRILKDPWDEKYEDWKNDFFSEFQKVLGMKNMKQNFQNSERYLG